MNAVISFVLHLLALCVQLVGTASIGVFVMLVDYSVTCYRRHEYKNLPKTVCMALAGLVFGALLLWAGTVWHEKLWQADKIREHGCICGGVCPCHKEVRHVEGH